MPETEATSSDSPYTALGLPDTSATVRDVTSKMLPAQREKTAGDEKVLSQLEGVTDRTLPRLEEMSKHMGVEAEKMKPWNADEEAAKRRTDPIEAFGSFGSVFGILASAFTHAPMANALNASAAAMESIKQGDEKAYTRAAKAWEDNNKQALDRHRIQHEAYQDATALLSTNMAAANTKLQVLATRFGDKQVQTLLEAGMNKEVEELLAARQKNAIALAEVAPRIMEENARMGRLLSFGYDPKNPASEKSQKAFKEMRDENLAYEKAKRQLTPQQEAYENFIKTKPDATPDERASYIDQLFTRTRPLTPQQEAVNTFIAQHPEATAEEIRDFLVTLPGPGGAGGSKRQPKPEEAEIKRRQAEYVAQGMPDGEAYTKAVQEVKRAGVVPTAKLADDLTSKIDRIDYMEQTIGKVEDLLKKHKAITGLGGTVTRPGEVVSNWFGSNETDRAQFRRYISELQEWGPRALNDSSGRPLSAEAAKINNIIAGLSPGDTTQNTARAYNELRGLLKQMKDNLGKRRDGSQAAPAAAAPKPSSPKDAPWLRDPVVPGKRSDSGKEPNEQMAMSTLPKAPAATVSIPAGGNQSYRKREDGTWWLYDNFGPVGPMPNGWVPTPIGQQRGDTGENSEAA